MENITGKVVVTFLIQSLSSSSIFLRLKPENEVISENKSFGMVRLVVRFQ